MSKKKIPPLPDTLGLSPTGADPYPRDEGSMNGPRGYGMGLSTALLHRVKASPGPAAAAHANRHVRRLSAFPDGTSIPATAGSGSHPLKAMWARRVKLLPKIPGAVGRR